MLCLLLVLETDKGEREIEDRTSRDIETSDGTIGGESVLQESSQLFSRLAREVLEVQVVTTLVFFRYYLLYKSHLLFHFYFSFGYGFLGTFLVFIL